MTEKNKKKKKTCNYESNFFIYKCNRPLYDNEYCIFHSKDIEGKEDIFMDAFWKEYESKKMKGCFKFTGFIFPPEVDLLFAEYLSPDISGTNLQRAKLQGAKLLRAKIGWSNLNGADLQGADLKGAFLKSGNLQRVNLQGANLQGANLSEADLQGAELQGAFLLKTDLQGANLLRADLRGVDLQGADLQKTKFQGANLQGANLQGVFLLEANLQEANLLRADLRGGNLQKANLQKTNLQKAILYKANLQRADLRGSSLREGNFQGAVLHGADLKGADLWNADLSGADLRGSSFEKATVNEVKYNRSTIFKGIDVTQAKGSPRFVRFAKDQEFLEELQSTITGKIIYHIWSVFADCGRSIWRWVAWSLFFAVYFAINYFLIDYAFPTAFQFNTTIQEPTFWSYIYYSVVTFTTLGFGDIVPTAEWVQRWIMVEVILGYVMLGGLISIFANKLARRS